MRKQAEAHQAVIHILWQTGPTSHDVVPDSKGTFSVALLCLWPAAPEEGVAGTHLLQLTLLRESGLTENSNVHLVARQFPGDYHRPPSRFSVSNAFYEPHLGDNEVVIRPTIGIADHLGYQHVLSISPPDENIVQWLPAPRPRVHPRGLLPRWKAEEGTGILSKERVHPWTVAHCLLKKSPGAGCRDGIIALNVRHGIGLRCSALRRTGKQILPCRHPELPEAVLNA
ncbi:unnamed protein product [Schistocephalus solidus]|uniref:Uncharacterized protein n=1 Tax=Schistocephalus solidus TaxID=70667 RepID=A0A3P7F7M9_SCHSO|nr:unnamed protein product [Schistocephalus solidus]